MKYLIPVLALLLATQVQANLKSIEQTTALKSVLATMSQIASEGGSLEAFEYREFLTTLKTPKCKNVEAQEVVKYLSDSMGALDLADYGVQPEQVSLALQEFAQIIGAKPYQWCNGHINVHHSTTGLDQFSNEDYQVEFEWGYED